MMLSSALIELRDNLDARMSGSYGKLMVGE
jgi:hypothetical protein